MHLAINNTYFEVLLEGQAIVILSLESYISSVFLKMLVAFSVQETS